jgi:thiol-disulfide isomerase/thioredoxin
MSIAKKFIIFLFFIVLLAPFLTSAQEKVNIYFFKAEGCSHCAKEKAFLEKLKQEDAGIEKKNLKFPKMKTIACFSGK